jgi:hypothetical protein
MTRTWPWPPSGGATGPRGHGPPGGVTPGPRSNAGPRAGRHGPVARGQLHAGEIRQADRSVASSEAISGAQPGNSSRTEFPLTIRAGGRRVGRSRSTRSTAALGKMPPSGAAPFSGARHDLRPSPPARPPWSSSWAGPTRCRSKVEVITDLLTGVPASSALDGGPTQPVLADSTLHLDLVSSPSGDCVRPPRLASPGHHEPRSTGPIHDSGSPPRYRTS